MSHKVFDVHAMGWIAPPKFSCVSTCGAKNCQCCAVLAPTNMFQSYSTGRKFILISASSFNCKTRYVVYLISCKSCGMQYVGQTKQPLHKRLNGHRATIRNNKLNTFLCQHFNSDKHSVHDLSVQIIDTVDWEGRDVDEVADELNRKEDFYMKVLNTFYPLGLNDRQFGGGCVSNGQSNDYVYYSTPIPRRKRSHGIRKSGRKKVNFQNSHLSVLVKLRNLFEANETFEFYKCLKCTKDHELRLIYNCLMKDSSYFACVFTSFYFSRFHKNSSVVKVNSRVSFIFNFNCREVDLVDLTSIVNDKRICKLLPDELHEKCPPRIFYKLRAPIALQFCNYSKFLKSLTINDIKNIVTSDCACDLHKSFVCEDYGHVFTGDLNLVENDTLKEVMQFGTKFRLDYHETWENVIVNLENDLSENARRLSKKLRISFESFLPWLDKISEVIRIRVKRLRYSNIISTHKSNKYSQDVLKAALSSLHDKFVISTVDKASNNFAFICKKFFLSVLLDELGFDKINFLPIGNVTYAPVNDNYDDIVDRHTKALFQKFNIKCSSEDNVLPRIFWIPKLHKNPYKFRFIAGARHCTTKPLSVVINRGLSVIKDNFSKYCDAIQRNSGYNFFWSVNSTFQFLDKLKDVQVHNVQVYDFSTLYTKLDQDSILKHVEALLDLVFNSTNRKYLCIRFDKSFFSSKRYESFNCFDLLQFKESVRFIVNEVFVSFGGFIFKQIKGIPMGGNCSPLLADLFLAHCEFLYMSSLLKNKKFGLARLLSNTSRYIDDLCFINYRNFVSIIDSIYPSELSAERNGEDNKNVEYLDVKLKVADGNLQTSVFHKVDNFKFKVILLTFPDSLIPYKMGLNVFAGQVVRYARICSQFSDFVDKTRKTVNLLISRGYARHKLQSHMERSLHKNSNFLHKFGVFSARQVSILVGLCSSS